MTQKKGIKGGAALAQSMDPTRSSEDFIGATTGLTGFTTGSAHKTSATPYDAQKDQNKDHLPGGIMESHLTDGSRGRLSPTTDDSDTLTNMSSVAREEVEDIASETRVARNLPKAAHPNPDEQAYMVDVSDEHDTQLTQFRDEESLGEQSISGSASDPSSDDDTLEAAHAVGTQLSESDDMEHPQELDIARDVDEAEEFLRTH